MAGDFQISGLKELTDDLARAAAEALPAVRAVTQASGENLRALWVANARQTAGKHGRWYPSAITAEDRLTFGGASVDVGPETGRRQGRMGRGFEYGSVNQPPHLDGNRAADVVEPQFATLIEAAAVGLL